MGLCWYPRTRTRYGNARLRELCICNAWGFVDTPGPEHGMVAPGLESYVYVTHGAFHCAWIEVRKFEAVRRAIADAEYNIYDWNTYQDRRSSRPIRQHTHHKKKVFHRDVCRWRRKVFKQYWVPFFTSSVFAAKPFSARIFAFDNERAVYFLARSVLYWDETLRNELILSLKWKSTLLQRAFKGCIKKVTKLKC